MVQGSRNATIRAAGAALSAIGGGFQKIPLRKHINPTIFPFFSSHLRHYLVNDTFLPRIRHIEIGENHWTTQYGGHQEDLPALQGREQGELHSLTAPRLVPVRGVCWDLWHRRRWFSIRIADLPCSRRWSHTSRLDFPSLRTPQMFSSPWRKVVLVSAAVVMTATTKCTC